MGLEIHTEIFGCGRSLVVKHFTQPPPKHSVETSDPHFLPQKKVFNPKRKSFQTLSGLDRKLCSIRPPALSFTPVEHVAKRGHLAQARPSVSPGTPPISSWILKDELSILFFLRGSPWSHRPNPVAMSRHRVISYVSVVWA